MSNVKLTLSLNDVVIKAAKKWADQNKTSLSKVVEDYFIKLLQGGIKTAEIHPTLKAMQGIAEVNEPPAEYKADVIKYLEKKYLNEGAD